MKDRIRMIMESEDYTPARFADTLDIGRAIVSHILNGRNNPSLDVISRILEAFPSINPDWLLFGTGEMYRDNVASKSLSAETNAVEQAQSDSVANKKTLDLFSQPNDIFTAKNQSDIPKTILPEVADPTPATTNTPKLEKEEFSSSSVDVENIGSMNEKIVYKTLPAKKISQIIIYYDDNTFEVFNQ